MLNRLELVASNPVPFDPIPGALAAAASDPGALFEAGILAELRHIRANDPARFARLRADAKALRVPVGEFDRLTAPAADTAAQSAMFADVEPWPSPVNGADLLGEVCDALQRHVIADDATIHAAALWAVHTHLLDVATVSPIANITAPEKRCGKTVLLNALAKIVARPLVTSNIAPAALFRSIELWSPTLLIDEVDSFLRDNDEARGILNSGLYRESAFVIRCVGDDHTPTRFSVWAPKALCGIGKLADTLADRSIPLRLRRKTVSERVESLRHADKAQWSRLCARIVRWANDNRAKIAAARTFPIANMHDRANDCWEPLLVIADAAGGSWPKLAREAAMRLHGVEGEAPSVNAELLTDIREAFEAARTARLSSAELLERLTADSEAPWATWNHGKPMTARQLAKRLGDFGIQSQNMRDGLRVVKGYESDAFADAFSRYLLADAPFSSATPLQPHNSAVSCGFVSATHPLPVADENPEKTALQRHCSGVADSDPLPEKKEAVCPRCAGEGCRWCEHATPHGASA